MRLYLFIISLLLTPSFLKAEVIREFFDTSETVANQWVAVKDGDEFYLVEAFQEINSGGVLSIFAQIDEISDGALVAAVFQTDSGRVLSSPMRAVLASPKLITLKDDGTQTATSVVDLLQARRDTLKRLEGEYYLLNLKKRREAGFAEVDRILEKIDFVKKDISRFKINQ